MDISMNAESPWQQHTGDKLPKADLGTTDDNFTKPDTGPMTPNLDACTINNTGVDNNTDADNGNETGPGIEPFMCGFCQEKFSDLDVYLRHVKTHSDWSDKLFHICNINNKSVWPDGDVPSYQCRVCSKQFQSVCSLHNHITETGDGSYVFDHTRSIAYPLSMNCVNTINTDLNPERSYELLDESDVSSIMKVKKFITTKCVSKFFLERAGIKIIDTNRGRGRPRKESEETVKVETEPSVPTRGRGRPRKEVDDKCVNKVPRRKSIILTGNEQVIIVRPDKEVVNPYPRAMPIRSKRKSNLPKKLPQTGGLNETAINMNISNTVEAGVEEIEDRLIENVGNRDSSDTELSVATNSVTRNILPPNSEEEDYVPEYNMDTESGESGETLLEKQHSDKKQKQKKVKCPKKLKQKKVKCPKCSKNILETRLDQHIKGHSEIRPHQCEICSQSYRSAQSLKQHIAQNHEDILEKKTGKKLEKFKCPECPECPQFLFRFQLKRHMMSHCTERPFKCEQCPKTFKRKVHLKDHLATHMEIKPFYCEFCGKGFTNATSMRHHRLVHHDGSDSKPFCCKICGARFIIQSKLDRHMIRHTGVKSSQCHVCGMGFTNRWNLSVHVRGVHKKDRRYSCEECDKQFLTNYQLKVHLLKHTGTRPFKCGVCNAEFYERKELRRHMKKQHNMHLDQNNSSEDGGTSHSFNTVFTEMFGENNLKTSATNNQDTSIDSTITESLLLTSNNSVLPFSVSELPQTSVYEVKDYGNYIISSDKPIMTSSADVQEYSTNPSMIPGVPLTVTSMGSAYQFLTSDKDNERQWSLKNNYPVQAEVETNGD